MLKLLYIDDDLSALELYKEMFEDDFEVTTCSEPEQGLEALRGGKYDAILLDIYFPGTTGFDIMLDVRTIPHARNTPLFFISSENTLNNRLKAINMGSEDFINRYMDPEEIIARIKKKVERFKENQRLKEEAILKLGDLELDQDNLTVTCNGELRNLTQTEYKIIYMLLKQFISDPTQVIVKEDLIKFVWPMDPESVLPRTLSTHLTNLRKKLDSKKVKIASIRQSGFRLKVS